MNGGEAGITCDSYEMCVRKSDLTKNIFWWYCLPTQCANCRLGASLIGMLITPIKVTKTPPKYLHDKKRLGKFAVAVLNLFIFCKLYSDLYFVSTDVTNLS